MFYLEHRSSPAGECTYTQSRGPKIVFVKNQKLTMAGLSPSEGKVEQDGVRDRDRT